MNGDFRRIVKAVSDYGNGHWFSDTPLYIEGYNLEFDAYVDHVARALEEESPVWITAECRVPIHENAALVGALLCLELESDVSAEPTAPRPEDVAFLRFMPYVEEAARLERARLGGDEEQKLDEDTWPFTGLFFSNIHHNGLEILKSHMCVLKP